MRFNVLGPLGVTDAGQTLALRGRQEQKLLGLLLATPAHSPRLPTVPLVRHETFPSGWARSHHLLHPDLG